jgi:DNA-binding NtrC family response regulator
VAKILLIDDDEDLTCFLKGALDDQGHEVQVLDRADEAPEVLAGTPFDLVLLDNKLRAGMFGIEFLEDLHRGGNKVPVILMTGDPTCDVAIRAMVLKAFDYVIKPDDFQALFRELEPIIARALEITRRPEPVPLAAEGPRPAAAEPMLQGPSKAMAKVSKLIGSFAPQDAAVLIRGETGTGKELVARALHAYSPRKDNFFVALNCAAIPENLLESELFGHEKGAFTSAVPRKGKLEYADGGSLFLDEIGDMPLPMQAKLLRVLQDQQFERVGGNETVRVNVRFLSATNCDLETAIREGRFRRDLFFRLNPLSIQLPPLRERLDDLPALAAYFLARAVEGTGREPPALSAAALDALRAHRWPGNVRELQNVLHRAVAVGRGPEILPAHLDFAADEDGAPAPAGNPSAADDGIAGLHRAILWAWESDQQKLWPLLQDLLERELLRVALAKLGGNQTRVAERLAMCRTTVIDRMKKHGLK